jgi:polyphosphate kinase 2
MDQYKQSIIDNLTAPKKITKDINTANSKKEVVYTQNINKIIDHYKEMKNILGDYKSLSRNILKVGIQKIYNLEQLKLYQLELIKMQNYLEKTKKKMIVLFEGRDASGKGGAIRRITRYMNNKHYRVVALGKPTDTQRYQWYFQRYIEHFPTAGEVVLFDRSWYNRAMVEPVMGFCTEREHHKFLKDAPAFEKMIVDADIQLFKFYFSVSKEEQEKRFKSRESDPLKQYKLSPVDKESQKLWDEYSLAKYMMLSATHTEDAPWTIIKSDNKRKARINCIKHILNFVEYPNKLGKKKIAVEKEVVIYGRDETIAMEKMFKFQPSR